MNAAAITNAWAQAALRLPQPAPVRRGPQPQFQASPAPRMLSMAQLINQQQALEASLLAAMAQASPQVAPQLRQQFAARAAAMVSDVVADSMYPVHTTMLRASQHTVSWEQFQTAAAQARALVARHQEVALALQAMFDPVPHVQTLGSGKILLLRAAPAIENLVLAGGGARGVANAPALRALENLGLLSELKQVVGTSVGAMTAILLASGVSPKAFQQLLNGTDLLSLLTTPPDFARNYPDVTLESLGFDAGAVLQTLDRMVAQSAASYLEGDWTQITQQPQWARFTPQEQQRLDLLRRPDFAAPRNAQMLTFGDLHLLRQLAPERFKELVVTGWNQSEKRLAYFSHQTAPDMALALAGRISMGIPGLFADVKIQHQGQEQHWTDGGVGSNVPSEAVFQGLRGQALEDARARTLVMVFEGHGKAYAAMHGPPDQRTQSVNPVFSWLSGNPNYSDVQNADRRKVYAAGLHVMPVFHGDLGIGSFHAGADRVERAKTEALCGALAFIEQHRNNYRHDLVDDVQTAAALLSPVEQEQFLARHLGDTTPLQASLSAAIQEQRLVPGTAAAQQAAVQAWASREPQRVFG